MEEEVIKEELRKDILDILGYCINCRFCLPSCPRFEITSGEICQGASGITRSLYYAVKWRLTDKAILNELRDIVYSCMTCKNCEIACKNLSTGTRLLDAIEKGRQLLLEEMIGPMPEQKRALESLINYGNPYGMPSSKRTIWTTPMPSTSGSCWWCPPTWSHPPPHSRRPAHRPHRLLRRPARPQPHDPG